MRRVLLAFALAAALARCSDYTPGEAQFRQRMAPFLVDGATAVKPQYANQDVDSMYGRYTVAMPPAAVLTAVERRAAAGGWRVVRRDDSSIELHRSQRGVVASYEIARVVVTGSTVHVAWIQMDGPTDPSSAARSHEARWAATNFWPAFERSLTVD